MLERGRLLPNRAKHTTPDTPLAIVNIVFLLLFFFLATGSMVNGPNFDINLSQVADLPVDELPHPILIVDQDGSLTLNGENVAEQDLAQSLKDFTSIYLLIDRTAPAQTLLDFITRPELKALDVQLVVQKLIEEQ